jgi:hypothetical protein
MLITSLVNCIDAAVLFYQYFPDKDKVCIELNYNPDTGLTQDTTGCQYNHGSVGAPLILTDNLYGKLIYSVGYFLPL